MTISALGDSAMELSLGNRLDDDVSRKVRAIVVEIERERPAGVVDVVGAFASVAVFGERNASFDFDAVRACLEACFARADGVRAVDETREREIPVCYGGEFGPDLEAVARHAAMTVDEVIVAHASAAYRVQAIGFSPGFPYLAGLPERLAIPRRATPRPSVAAGSVGIGGGQTGVYPFATPGGWNLIGRTPLRLFNVGREEPSWLRAGDQVRFRAIEPAEYRELQDALEAELALKRGANDQAQAGGATVRVVRAGMLTSVQDAGREGYRAQGVASGGAADVFAARVANLLVGNPDDAAVLEFTLQGPTLMFAEDTMVAFSGGDFGLPRWRPLRVRAGETLHIGPVQQGCRGYLALGGGVAVPRVLGSCSTDLRAGFGGLHGRMLRDGDGLRVGHVEREVRGKWWLDERMLPRYSDSATVRVVAGAQSREFDDGWQGVKYAVTPRSDRMGVRFQGASLVRRTTAELVSSPVAPGTIQVPPDGQPIVLLADAQTIGGYPKLGHVITVDLPVVAQLKPGDTVRFERVSLEEARAALQARERALGILREGVTQKLA